MQIEAKNENENKNKSKKGNTARNIIMIVIVLLLAFGISLGTSLKVCDSAVPASAGVNGSAYEIAVENGYTGSETDWLATNYGRRHSHYRKRGRCSLCNNPRGYRRNRR